MLSWEIFARSEAEFLQGHGFGDMPAFKAFEACCDGEIIGCDPDKKCKEQVS
jgi:hypothetical protein